jgi:hypothetical protein
MYFLKTQIPEYKNLTKKQRRTVRSVLQRKEYSWLRNTFPNFIFFGIVLWAATFLNNLTEWSGPIALLVFYSLQWFYKFILSVLETNQLAKSPGFIETYKDYEWGF